MIANCDAVNVEQRSAPTATDVADSNCDSDEEEQQARAELARLEQAAAEARKRTEDAARRRAEKKAAVAASTPKEDEALLSGSERTVATTEEDSTPSTTVPTCAESASTEPKLNFEEPQQNVQHGIQTAETVREESAANSMVGVGVTFKRDRDSAMFVGNAFGGMSEFNFSHSVRVVN